MSAYQPVVHPIPPFYDASSHILILGSFPSVKSREMQFFYGHPQNRFWKVLAILFDEPYPESVPERADLLRRHHIAVWDVIQSCDIMGSSDASIRNVVANDLSVILDTAEIREIYVNGRTAQRMYRKYIKERIGKDAVCLPSTSPANAACSLDQLIKAWSVILEKTE